MVLPAVVATAANAVTASATAASLQMYCEIDSKELCIQIAIGKKFSFNLFHFVSRALKHQAVFQRIL